MTVQVVKLGFVGFDVADRQAMVGHFRDIIGMPLSEDTADASFLACGDDLHGLGLYDSAARTGIRHVGFRIDSRIALDDAERDLVASGVSVRRLSDAFPGIADALLITDPDGYAVYLYNTALPAPVPYSGFGVGPVKLSHVALFVENAPRAADFYTRVLGFRWSDWCEELFVFMRCNSDHHSLNLTTGKPRKLFHLALELRDLSHVGRGCDVLSAAGTPVVWGPGRHGMGHNIFAYHRDPEGNTIEFCAEMDRMSDEGVGFFDPRPYHEDRPQRPKVWPFGPESSNIWGVMPPAGFME